MAVTQELSNNDKLFESIKKETTIIVNDVNALIDNEAATSVNEELYTIYNKSYIDNLPTCNCGNYKSKFREGKVCPKCNTICKEEKGSKPVIWIRAFNNMPFINVTFWSMVRYTIDRKFDVLRYLSDTSYNPTKKPEYIHGLVSIVGKRTYNNMLNNFIKIIEYIKNVSKFKRETQVIQALDDIINIWETKKIDIFSKHLPIHNKKLFVMEATNKGRFINLLVSTTVDVVNGWLLTNGEISENKMSNLTAKTISMLSESDRGIVKDYIAGKKKLLRKHIYGFRVPFSFRCTITSIPGPHEYDVIEIPYTVGVTAFEPMILNLLVNRYKMKFMEAQRFIYRHINIVSPLISEILDTLVEESPYKGIPISMQRNPTLMPGSILMVYGRFKKDDTKTVGVSKKIVSIGNGDYDGDQLNFSILMDNYIAERFKIYETHYNMVGYGAPFEKSGLITMQSPAYSLLSEWLKDGVNNMEEDNFWNKVNNASN